MTDTNEFNESPWKSHLYKVNVYSEGYTEEEFAAILSAEEKKREKKLAEWRKRIEPWLSALFQSEHLSLLVGSGLTRAIATIAEVQEVADMEPAEQEGDLDAQVNEAAKQAAKQMGRGSANIEDQIRTQLELLKGLEILKDERAEIVKNSLNSRLTNFLASILQTEQGIYEKLSADDEQNNAQDMLISFLLSFAARSASRERLNLFTTNYDRLIEFGCDLAGLRLLDRFVGTLTPVFRASRLNIDVHYNPPGIRGEPRYLEGVIRLSKLHGSIDWNNSGGDIVRVGLPFGAASEHPGVPASPVDSVMIYPNPAKDVETAQYPYAELFRDFAASICRPNSVLVVYGYGFGDDHINRVIKDMLTIPSTHLVVLSRSNTEGRVQRFCQSVGRPAQISILLGSHFADLQSLIERYLPKPAIDPISFRQSQLLERRGAGKAARPEEEPDVVDLPGGKDDIDGEHPE